MGYAGQGVGAVGYSAAVVARQTPAQFYNASTWAACDATSAAPFSAVGYFFGKEIRNALDVPVGLINMSVGGSPAEAWMRRAVIPPALTAPNWTTNNTNLEAWCNGRAIVQLGTLIGSAPGDDMGPNHAFKPTFLWDSGPARLAPFAMRGVLWYQGESNALSHSGEVGVTNPKWRIDQHEVLFPLLVNDWRKQWGQGNFPFLVCQLSSIVDPTREFWPEFRDYQRRATALLPNMGLAVTSDIGSNSSNVHPTNKRDVGKRLARWAQRYSYGDTAALPCPLPATATRVGGTVTVAFNDAGPALTTSNGAAPASFELAGADGVFFAANASVSGATVAVTSASVPTPALVRYAWQPYSTGNLVNSAGLPASTFVLNVAP
jgi:sialate O-acetylesterase